MGGRASSNENSFIHYEDRTDAIVVRSVPLKGPTTWIRYKSGYKSAAGDDLISLRNELDSQ